VAHNPRLRPMTPQRLREWLPGMWADYRASIIAAGDSPEAADANVARNKALLTSGEGLVEGQHVFQVLLDGAEVGVLWIGRRSGEAPREYYIYDVVIREDRRGEGLGRAAMKLAAEWVRSQGGTRIALNVWGNNAVARSLYRSLGYVELAVTMVADL
jgi:ribosomal protein S18 acetylase RimI-like enzyme